MTITSSLRFLYIFWGSGLLWGAQQCFGKNKTKNSNIHDSLKVMKLNPGFVLKSSLL